MSTATPANDWPLPTVEIEEAERLGLVVRPSSPGADQSVYKLLCADGIHEVDGSCCATSAGVSR